MNDDLAASVLRSMFDAAVGSADPLVCVPAALPPRPKGRVVVIGAGKASARMAQAVEAAWGEGLEGLVVTRYGHGAPCRSIKIIEAAHPVPDAAGQAAAAQILQLAQSLGPDDTCLALISGGGSALLTLPAAGVTLHDKQTVNAALLASGASIDEMNSLRKHLSAIKGGRLAAAVAPAQLLTLMISDVPGDDPAVIASGPTVGDPTTLADARHILSRYNISVPKTIHAALQDHRNETPAIDDQIFERSEACLIATPQMALEAAAKVARAAGITPLILGDALEGEARELGRVMAGMAKQIRRHAQPVPAPCVLLSGGETTVTLRGKGRGGRNVECLLGMAQALQGATGIHAICADTDGVDGIEEIAGATLHPDTVMRAARAGYRLDAALAENDGHSYFEAAGTQIITGPTLTNVNDFRAVLVL